MSTLLAMGITTRDPQSDQSESMSFDHKAIRNLHASVLQRAIHDLERYKEFPNSENQKWAICAQKWILEDKGSISFLEICNTLNYDVDQVLNRLIFLDLFLLEEQMKVKKVYRRKHQLSLVTPLDRKGGSH